MDFYNTDFKTAENPLSLGGKWTNGRDFGLKWNNVQAVDGIACGAAFVGLGESRYDDCIAHLNTAFGADQYAQGTVFRIPGYKNPRDKHEIELLLRFKITADTARGYEVLWGQDGEIVVVRWNGPLGDYTSLGGAPDSPAMEAKDGDVLRAEITGNVVKVYRNGGLVVTASDPDSAWNDGRPGVGFWPLPGATLTSYGWKDFEAGGIQLYS